MLTMGDFYLELVLLVHIGQQLFHQDGLSDTSVFASFHDI